MSEAKLEFLKNEAGEKEGLGDAGIETFKDAPYASCAREAGQNSRDAEDRLPVQMTFNVMSIGHDQFPAHAALLKALEACQAMAAQDKEKEFFTNALAVAKRTNIPVLEIADYNTKGLIGPPDEPGTPFHSLLKASGVSAKESDTSGGSFGIGKNASFAVSDLQMVLYSTCYVGTDGEEEFAAQGKIKLVSHRDGASTMRRATGYWGDPNAFRAITNTGLIPDWMRRARKGTSIFCMGFRESVDWAEHMTSSVVMNFFTAIHRKEMEFEINNGEFQVNKNTLEGLLNSEAIRRASDKSGDLQGLEFAGQLYRCLVSAAAEDSIITIDGLGDVRVRVLIQEGLPKRVGFVRNGMLITDNLRYFGHPLSRFPSSRDFVALVEPADAQAGRLFKRLENPAHDNLSAQRIADPAKRAVAETAMRKLGRKLRDLIKETTGVGQQDTVILEELGRFFADPGKADSPPDPNADHDPERHVFEPPSVRKRKRTVVTASKGDSGGRSGTGPGTGGSGRGAGPETGSGSGGRGNRGTRAAVELGDVRNILRRDEAGFATSRLIFFTPQANGTIRLAVEATGVNAPEVLQLTDTDTGTVDGDALILSAECGQRQQVTVTFDQPYDGPVEIVAVADNEVEDAA